MRTFLMSSRRGIGGEPACRWSGNHVAWVRTRWSAEGPLRRSIGRTGGPSKFGVVCHASGQPGSPHPGNPPIRGTDSTESCQAGSPRIASLPPSGDPASVSLLLCHRFCATASVSLLLCHLLLCHLLLCHLLLCHLLLVPYPRTCASRPGAPGLFEGRRPQHPRTSHATVQYRRSFADLLRLRD